jgi:hypothetical protein
MSTERPMNRLGTILATIKTAMIPIKKFRFINIRADHTVDLDSRMFDDSSNR